MRKFNLKGKVAQKLKGIEPDTVKAGQDDAALNSGGKENTPAENTGIALTWRSDVGRIRKTNQDSVIIDGRLYGVADGMGGHNGGEIASAGLRDGLIRETAGQEPGIQNLEEAIRKVNLELWNQQEQDAALTGMGTTLTVLWAAEKEMIIAQVGDSRAYLIRDGQMEQVTTDHSMVADMVRRGVLTEEQAACHPMRNYITRAVGTDDTIEADITTIRRQTGDRWLICSDGLYGQIGKQEMQKLAMKENMEKAADQLLKTALENGGKDNISFILLQDNEIRTEDEEEEKEPETAEQDAETLTESKSEEEEIQ